MIDLFKGDDFLESYAPGDVIFELGDDADCMFAVIDGSVELRHGERVLEVVKTGGVFGEVALIDDSPRSATAVAKTPCKIARVDEKRFLWLVEQKPLFSLQVMRVLARRLRRQTATDQAV